MPCSTAGRRAPGLRPATVMSCGCTRTWAWWRRPSTPTHSSVSPGTSRSVTREVPGETLECVGVEGLRHQAHVLVHAQDMTVAGRNPGALLPAVLQGIKAEIGQVGNVLAGGVDAEQTAGFVHPLVGHQMTHQNAVSQDCPRVSNEMRMSDPTWKSSPPTTPIACSGT